MLTSCDGFPPVLKTQPTQAMETALAIVGTAMAETQTAIPTATSTSTLLPTATPLPTFSPLPPTETPTPIKTSIPVSGTPTTIELEDGLVWTECIVPPYTSTDSDFATTCLNMNFWADDHNMMLNSQRLSGKRVKGICGDNLRLVIGKDIYETKHTVPRENACGSYNYELLKNGVVIATVKGVISNVVDANRKLWNVDGKSVWEISSDPPAQYLSAIIVDGVNQNEKYQLEGSFDVYYFKDKIIFIALKNGKYHIMYNGKFIGHEFDEIFIYGGPPSVLYGHEQYWFLGRYEGTYYVVAIH